MYKNGKRWLFRLFFCMFYAATLFSQEHNTISEDLFKYFSLKNLHPEVQYLQNSQSNQFPFTIILPFEPEISDDKPLFFVFSQKTAKTNPDIIEAFSSSGTVVLAANLESDLPVSLQTETLSGLRTFIETISKDSFIIIVSESSSLDADYMELIPGGNGFIASKDAVQAVFHASQLADYTMSIQSLLLSFYRLNWIEGSETASLCLEKGFQAAELVISNKVSPVKLAQYASFLRNELKRTTFSEGTQYSIINTGTQVITISENLYIKILFIILGITLLGSCLFSFMFGQSKTENRTIFLKWWYLGPLLILMLFFITWFSQIIITSLFTNYTLHPGYALFLKSLLITVIFLLLCELRYFIPLAQTDYLYAFFMTLAASLDVFLFTSVDMPLLLPFSAIYIIFLIARPVKKTWINILLFIAELTPLIYVLFRASPYLKESVFVSLTNASPVIVLFTSVLFLPYLLMLIHIFVCAGIWNKNKGKKRILIETIILSGCLFIIILLSAFQFSNKSESTKQGSEISQVLPSKEKNIQIQAEACHENGMISFELILDDEYDVLRYDVSAHSSSSIPVYSANLPFSFSETPATIIFDLDEYPCNPFIIKGLAPDVLPLEFRITSWNKEFDTVFSEEYSVVFEEDFTGKNTHIKAIIK